MIDLANESLMSLAQAAATLPAGQQGRKVHVSTVLRWILKGVRTPAGRVRLEGVRLGGRWLTSREALQRFADRQTPDCPPPAPTPRMSAARRRHLEQVEKELTRLGIWPGLELVRVRNRYAASVRIYPRFFSWKRILRIGAAVLDGARQPIP